MRKFDVTFTRRRYEIRVIHEEAAVTIEAADFGEALGAARDMAESREADDLGWTQTRSETPGPWASVAEVKRSTSDKETER